MSALSSAMTMRGWADRPPAAAGAGAGVAGGPRDASGPIAAAGAADAVKALEQLRQRTRVDAGAGVAHREHGVAAVADQPDGNGAVQGELERIRQQVEHDLLPHLPVDGDGLVERRAVDG